MGIAQLETSAAASRQYADISARYGLSAQESRSAMDRLKQEQQSYMDRLVYQTQAQQAEAELDRILRKYGVDLQAMTGIFETGVR